MSVSPNVSAAMRAAPGTPGGSTPRTKSERLANSGVRAETMPVTTDRRGGPTEHELPAKSAKPHVRQGTWERG